MQGIILQIFKYIVKATVFVGVIIAFTILLSTLITLVGAGLNGGLIGDIVAMIQIWLPFNFAMMLNWLLLISGLYITYRTLYWSMLRVKEYMD